MRDNALTKLGDPGGDLDGSDIKVEALSPSEKVNHQEAWVPLNDQVQLRDPPPPCHLAHSNKGILPRHPYEDLKLEQGSRPCMAQTPAIQPQNLDPVGESDVNVVGDDISALYLTVDAPQSYQEAMWQYNAADWVEAIAIKYENLHHRGIFVEVEESLDICVHEGWLVFTEKI